MFVVPITTDTGLVLGWGRGGYIVHGAACHKERRTDLRFLRYANGEVAITQIACPVLFLLGGVDQMTPPKAIAPLVELLKPRVVTLPSGHALMGEVPDALLGTLVEALRAPAI
jgi:pimeloyl-ACP methyl ester carboxylesterase